MSSEQPTSRETSSQSDTAADYLPLHSLGAYIGGIAGCVALFILGPIVLGGGAPAVELTQVVFFALVISAFVVPAALLGRRAGGRAKQALVGE